MSWKDDAKRRVNEAKQGKRFTLAEGENTFRFMPAKEGPEHPPYVEYGTHYNVGPDQAACRCGKNGDGEGDCWLCDKKMPELAKSASREKRMQAAALVRKNDLMTQVSPIDETGKFGAPKPWSLLVW